MRSLALALLLSVTQPLLAQDEDDTQRAVILFEESETAYNAGQFEQAAALLRRAYALHPDPTLLFNLARALEGDGDLDGAIESYEDYLEAAPEASDRGAVEARVRTLRSQRDQLETQREPVDEPEPEPEQPEPVAESNGPALGGWIVAAGGAAVLAAGIGLGVASQNRSDDADAEPVQERAQALHDEAKTRATVANVFFIVGGAMIAGGVLWGILTLGGDDETQVSVGPGTLNVRHRF